MIDAPIRYFSTNQGILGTPDLEARIANGSLETADLGTAIIKGQAPDGGLYMPSHFPQISLDTIASMKDMSYARVFVEVMKDFFQDILSKSTLEKIAHDAYEGDNPFEPFIEQISKIDFIGRLDEGPTAAFKDYAAQVLFRIIEALRVEQPKIVLDGDSYLGDVDLLTFITATSGDTGGAMGYAILNRERMWMAILHSASIGKEISDLQAKQMDTLGNNAYAIWANTDFDGCQKFAQDLLKDPELKYMNLNSANSINIGRLLPQIAYYFYIYSRIAEPGEEVVFSVPCGNFGDLVAGIFAQRMGLPIKLIAGVNENDVFERLYRTDLYAPAPETHSSPSNSMNVNWPSNMRRVVQMYGGQLIEGKDPDNPEQKVIERWRKPDFSHMKQEIVGAYSISDEKTEQLIEQFYRQRYMIATHRGNIISTIEPHTGVSEGAAQQYRHDTGYNKKIVRFGTGHPGKFPEVLHKLGIQPQLPLSLGRLVNIPHGRYFKANNYNEAKALVTQFHQLELAKYK